jgi:hypothetical protein
MERVEHGMNGPGVMEPARLLVTLDCADPADLAEFWSQALGYGVVGGDGQTFVALGPADERRLPPLYLQRVPEQKVLKNRQHLDLCCRDPERAVSRLEALGATRLGLPFGGRPWRWQVMRDPEDNEFCVVREEPDGLVQGP